jgi:Uma2 family endonuclease
MVLSPHRHQISVSEWHKMSDVFEPGQHIELINGEITNMSPTGFSHAGSLKYLNNFFNRLLSENTLVSIQDPLQLNEFSEPEPDLILLKSAPDFYKHRHPNASDVLLLIEISDSSLSFDRTEKLQLYAEHNIIEYWIVNLNEKCLEVYRQPKGNFYQQRLVLTSSEYIQPLQFSNVNLKISDIF